MRKLVALPRGPLVNDDGMAELIAESTPRAESDMRSHLRTVAGSAYLLLVGAASVISGPQWWGLAGAVGVSYLLLRRQIDSGLHRRRMAKLHRKQQWGELIEQQEDWLDETTDPGQHTVAAFELGYAHLRAGHAALACAALSECIRLQSRTVPPVGLPVWSRQFLALAYLSAGDLRSSAHWVKGLEHGPAVAAVHLRADRPEQVLRVPTELTPPLGGPHGVHAGRLLHLFRAFALSETGTGDAAADRAVCRQAPLGSYDYLCRDWPELGEFVSTLELQPNQGAAIPDARLLPSR